MQFVYQAVRLANGVHASGDVQAKHCTEHRIHGTGMLLEIRLREALGLSPEILPKHALDGLI